MLYMLFQSFNT